MNPIRWLCLMLLLGISTAVAEEPQTARDAYLEAWFQETAEGNLQQALLYYGRCVELGAAEERELVARAAWRMARIARARGDEEAALLQLQRIVERYAGTKAAELASADLAEGVEPGDRGRESVAVEEARLRLREMLTESATVTSPGVKMVFQTLELDEIFATSEDYQKSLVVLVSQLKSPAFEPLLVELFVRSRDYGVQEQALEFLGTNSPGWQIPERLREGLVRSEGYLALTVLKFLVGGRFARSLDVLKQFVETADEERRDNLLSRMPLAMLLEDEREEAADVLGLLLDQLLAGHENPGGVISDLSNESMITLTPAVRRLILRLPEFSAGVREAWAARLVGGWFGNLESDVVQILLDDPEPLVRRWGIKALLRSPDPAQRLEGIRTLCQEPPPYPVEVIEEYIRHQGQIMPSVEELSTFPAGVLRECAYRLALQDQRRNPAEILSHALDNNHTEILGALFEPAGAKSNILSRRGGIWSPTDLGRGFSPSRFMDLKAGLQAYSRTDIGRRLAEMVLACPSEAMRIHFVNFLEGSRGERSFDGVPDLMARDESARVRYWVMTRLRFSDFALATQVARVLDSDRQVAERALMACDDGAALEAAAHEISPLLLPQLAHRAVARKFTDAVRVAYHRLPDGDYATKACFLYLRADELDILLDGLLRGAPIRGQALELLDELRLPDPLRLSINQLAHGRRHPTDQAVAELSQQLEQGREVVEQAFRAFQIEQILAQRDDGESTEERYRRDGERLAELDAREELLALARMGTRPAVRIGGYGLSMLGMKEELLAALRETSTGELLALPALEAGLGEELVALVVAGQVPFHEVESAARRQLRADVLAALLCPSESGRTLAQSTQPGPNPTSFALTIDYLVEQKDVARLTGMARSYDQASAARALVHLEAYDAIFADLPRWLHVPRMAAFEELRRLTGAPGPDVTRWPQYLSEQQALIDRWREALSD